VLRPDDRCIMRRIESLGFLQRSGPWDGDAPESVVQSIPVLTLEQVYGAIAYYLRHQACIETYLRQAEAEESAVVEQLHR
jgi:hypothetical protein